ncbi:MAG: L-ribulose-5-phosphate 4-epimerase AraD [Oscillospiraceae bacterium]|nr:L-ribulose-5-phosphate 4-epimerase AraD [Oscillospiraceae bacterium]
MLEQLKEEVYRANMMLKEHNLVILTWGNVSGIDANHEYVVIKPSGVEYDKLTPESMVVVNLRGEVVEGDLKPSSDTPTHIELYKTYKEIGGVCHTHSLYATSFAQCSTQSVNIPALGTTHADYFDGAIPCTRALKKKEIRSDYEKNTGLVIVETLEKEKLSPEQMPAVLVKSHGPFTFGKNAAEAVEHSIILEEVAHLAANSILLTGVMSLGIIGYKMQDELLRKHFDRKHGANAYYGQTNKK